MMLAKYEDRTYILTLLKRSCTNKIKVEVEYKVKKGGIEALGFCSSNYTKTVIKRELVEYIPLRRNLNFSDEKLMNDLKDLIQEHGFDEAKERFERNVLNEREILLSVEDKKKLTGLDEKIKKKQQDSRGRRYLRDPANKAELKAFILDKRLAGYFYTSIIKSIKAEFKVSISKSTVMKLFKEACADEEIEYFTDSDIFYMHKSEVAGWIKDGLQRAEVIDRFKKEYGVELNKYYYKLARREATKC